MFTVRINRSRGIVIDKRQINPIVQHVVNGDTIAVIVPSRPPIAANIQETRRAVLRLNAPAIGTTRGPCLCTGKSRITSPCIHQEPARESKHAIEGLRPCRLKAIALGNRSNRTVHARIANAAFS